ncbi:Hpt domain-containing protein [Achromobacter sp. ESBL13]|uniref:Hpt domain-containing protein n=1 Tax=Achromobacter sp. ESBL13 TaxID=3077328 RepID=UPI002FC86E1F
MNKNNNEDPARRASPNGVSPSTNGGRAPVASSTAQLRHERRVRTITDLTGADPARIRALAHAFVKANDIDMLRLCELQARDDRAALRHLAHRIKGAAQMTGDTQLSRLCSVLSEACAAPRGHVLSLDGIVEQLSDALLEFGASCQRMAMQVPAP